MPTTNTFAFSPGLGEVGLFAFGLCQIRSTELTQQHMESLRVAANLLQGLWSAKTPNLWTVDLQTITITPGVGAYPVPVETVAILDAFATQNTGGAAINRVLTPISRSEYASFPNPSQVGQVTSYWFDRLLAPNLTFWEVPDGTISSISYYRARLIMDASLLGSTSLEMPPYFFAAFAFGLAYFLALVWKPELADRLEARYEKAKAIADDQNVETANLYIAPMLQSYWRA
jgi:hypothetical protein